MDSIEDDAQSLQETDEDAKSNDSSECLSQQSEGNINWYYMPDSILLIIFQYLTPKELMTAGEVCRSWHRVSRDEFLWKYIFYRTYKVDPDIGIMPGMLFIVFAILRCNRTHCVVSRSKITCYCFSYKMDGKYKFERCVPESVQT